MAKPPESFEKEPLAPDNVPLVGEAAAMRRERAKKEFKDFKEKPIPERVPQRIREEAEATMLHAIPEDSLLREILDGEADDRRIRGNPATEAALLYEIGTYGHFHGKRAVSPDVRTEARQILEEMMLREGESATRSLLKKDGEASKPGDFDDVT